MVQVKLRCSFNEGSAWQHKDDPVAIPVYSNKATGGWPASLDDDPLRIYSLLLKSPQQQLAILVITQLTHKTHPPAEASNAHRHVGGAAAGEPRAGASQSKAVLDRQGLHLGDPIHRRST
jgi:hypothetical protein